MTEREIKAIEERMALAIVAITQPADSTPRWSRGSNVRLDATVPTGDRMAENVNHPSHYGGDVQHETYKCLSAWGLESDALLWNAVKYLSRAGKKGPILEDLKKAQWYIAKRVEQLEAKCQQQ